MTTVKQHRPPAQGRGAKGADGFDRDNRRAARIIVNDPRSSGALRDWALDVLRGDDRQAELDLEEAR